MRTLLSVVLSAAMLSMSPFAAAQGTGEASPLAAYQPKPYVRITHPEWTKNASIYQLNTRQFTPEGTFKAAEKQLPRLKELGVQIVMLMPVNTISQKNRKGTLGSPYAVQDYLKVNPEFGTLEELKQFLATAHGLGLHVILDWVANHTGWDNVLVKEHPEWYERDWKGEFMPTPWFDWTDIIDLDYSKPALRKYMTDAMVYWVRQGFDGFRCDAAGLVPLDFWEQARHEMEKVKPVFMLGEWQSRDLLARAFDMMYAWTWYDVVKDVASGTKKDLGGPFNYYSWNEKFYPHDGMAMTFVSNHDKNSWEGTEFEAFGPGLMPAIVLSAVGEGMPLIYNGQEAGYNHRLAFFERDPIVWGPMAPEGELYKKLFALKKANTALWNAHWGARMIPVVNTAPNKVMSFVRQNQKDRVIAVLNFSAEAQTVSFKDAVFAGTFTEYFSGEKVELKPESTVTLPAWGYKVFVK